MSETNRIFCPSSKVSKQERIDNLIESLKKWVYSEELESLIALFDGDFQEEKNAKGFKDYVAFLNEFVDIWDYRKKQANGGERWNVKDESFVTEHQDEIMQKMRGLGLLDIIKPSFEADYILPLGGARLTNYSRPLRAKEVIDEQGWFGKNVVALSGFRPINEIELPYLELYAPKAKTEFDAICGGMEKALSLDSEYEEEFIEAENINLASAARRYKSSYKECTLHVLSAPSSDPDRRANSRDTFCYFLEKFDIKPGERLLLTTSCIYVPFQLLRFMDLAIEQGFEVDCIGSESQTEGTQFSNASNYLQETKATVNAIHGLCQKYL